MRRTLRWAVGLVAVLVVGYLIVANALLLTSLGPRLASSPRTHVAWRTGYSIIPGQVHLREATVGVAGKRATWRISSARVDLTLSPLSLLLGRLHAHAARAQDVTIIGEDAVGASEQPSPARRSPSPAPIALARPVAEPSAASPPLDRAETASVRFDDLILDGVHEVRAGAIAYRGDAVARGSLRVFDGAPARIDHATVDARTGELDVAGAPLLRDVRGHLTVNRQEVDTDAPTLRAWLGALDGGLELDAAVMTTPVAREGAAPRADGSLHASLRVVDGALAPESTAALHVPTLARGAADSSFSADLALAVAADGRATLGGVLHELAWPGTSEGASPIAVAGTVRVDGGSPRVRVSAPLRDATARLDVEDARFDPSRVPVLRSLTRAPPDALRASGRFTIEQGSASGRATAHSDHVDLTLGDHVVPGALDIDAELLAWPVGARDAHARLRATHSGSDPRATTTASVELNDAVVHLSAPPSIDAHAVVAMSSSLPALDAITGRAALPTVIAALASTQPLEASAELHADAHVTRLDDIHATAGLMSTRGVYANQDAQPAATLLLEAGPFAVGVSVDSAGTTLVLADPRSWFDAEAAPRAADRAAGPRSGPP